MASEAEVTIEMTDGGRKRDQELVVLKSIVAKSDEPLAHQAAESGSFNELKTLINENPHCIYGLGHSDQTVLHDAVESGDLEIVRLVLDTAETAEKQQLEGRLDKQSFVNLRDEGDLTALHLVAINGVVEIAKLLIEHGAHVNPDNQGVNYTKTPFHKAAYYGRVELAMYLLQQGADVSSTAFRDIVGGGYEKLAKAVIETDQWPLALRGEYKRHGKKTTAFRELIAKMPDVAEIVLNRCTVEEETKKESCDDKDYQVLFNYEFIEDYNSSGEEQSVGSKKETHGSSFAEIITTEKHRKPSLHCWGPKTFTKANHPLQIMVNYNRINLLLHPVVGSLIHHKWKMYGFWLYMANLLSFILFLVLLTTFALIVPNPRSVECGNAFNSTVCPDAIEDKRASIIGISAVVLILAFLRLAFEFIQFGTQTASFIVDCIHWPLEYAQLLPYVTGWVNWIEIAQYTCTIVFSIGIYTTNCFCYPSGLWQTGVAAVFLGWTVLILFISKLPLVGIYVIILTRICITYLKMFILTILMIFAFALTFYLIFFDLNIMRSPFADPAISLLKTMTMSTGDVSFGSIFRLDPSGDSDGKEEIGYPSISYIIWILFIIFMPIILINMLTSLAVDDTEKIRGEAQLENLALQVDQVLAIEEVYFTIKRCLPKQSLDFFDKLVIRYYEIVTPNKEKKWPLLNDFYFELWGGCRYDRSDAIVRVIDPPKTEVLERVLELEKDVKGMERDMKGMERDIKDIKGDMKTLLQMLAKDPKDRKPGSS